MVPGPRRALNLRKKIQQRHQQQPLEQTPCWGGSSLPAEYEGGGAPLHLLLLLFIYSLIYYHYTINKQQEPWGRGVAVPECLVSLALGLNPAHLGAELR